jgi:type IV fimbrial biogenesis protein FimT
LELIVTLTIVVILTSIALPAMREFGVRASVSTTTNDLVAALSLARVEAVKRGRNINVISNGGSWTAGWTVQTAAGEVLVQHDALVTAYRVLGIGTGAGAEVDRINFSATGSVVSPTGLPTGYEFSVCRPTFSPGNAQSRRVVVTPTGTIRSFRDTTSAPAGTC